MPLRENVRESPGARKTRRKKNQSPFHVIKDFFENGNLQKEMEDLDRLYLALVDIDSNKLKIGELKYMLRLYTQWVLYTRAKEIIDAAHRQRKINKAAASCNQAVVSNT